MKDCTVQKNCVVFFHGIWTLLLRASASVLGDVPEVRGEIENKWLSALQSGGEEDTLKKVLVYSLD